MHDVMLSYNGRPLWRRDATAAVSLDKSNVQGVSEKRGHLRCIIAMLAADRNIHELGLCWSCTRH